MVAFKFPMSSGKYIPKIAEEELVALCTNYCCMFRCAFTNLVPINDIEHPISSSKCRNKKGVVEDNGRVVTAEYAEITITEQDYFIYKRFYDWEHVEMFDCYVYLKEYLPTPFVKSILKLYGDKTTLKGVPGEEVHYLLSKEMVNSCYGMTVTDIVREVLSFSPTKDCGFESNYDEKGFKKEKFIAEMVEKYNNNPYRFLFYPWGVWVTAYARANLFSGILAAGRDYIYADTDSIKITNPDKHMDYINRYNEDISRCLQEACAHHKIDFDKTRPKTIAGEEKPLGVWDHEATYDAFKTLGAKRYLARIGNNWLFTVAGVNKVMAKNYLLEKVHQINRVRKHKNKHYLTPFDLFNIDLVVPKSHSGRNILTYIDEEDSGYLTDYLGNTYKYHELSGIHMESTDYSLNPVDAFINYLFTIREEMW